MSKHETFPGSQEATPIDARFEDPKLQETFTQTKATDPEMMADEAEASVTTKAEQLYQSERMAWKQAKAEYRDAKDRYETRLAEYYKNYSDKGIFGRGSQKLSEWWSGKPEDLVDLEDEFKAARGEYARRLDSVMRARGESSERNQNFDNTKLDSKKAFAKKFVLEPRKDQIALEKEHLVDTQTAERAQKVLQTLSKHKWTMRVGAVTATGLVVGSGAGIVAGLGAAGFRAARIAGGMAGGAIGARIGDKIGQEGVEVAKANLAKTKEDTMAEFTVQNIDELESALVNAEQTVDAKEQQRKFAIIAGAIMGGGGLANIDRIADATGEALVSTAEASTPDIEVLSEEPTRGELLGNTDKSIDPSEPSTNLEAEAIADDAAKALAASDPENKAFAAEVVRALEETRPEVNVGDHTVDAGDTLWKITENSFKSKLGELAESQRNQVLDAVFDDLRKDEVLTTELGIKSGNIDLIYPQDNLKMSVLESLIDEKLATLPEIVEAGPGMHVVEANETLWGITKSEYAEQLEGLSTAQKDQVLAEVFNDLRKDDALVAEMGIKSGNIDLIHPDDVLKISLLESLIEEKIASVNEPVAVADAAKDAAATTETITRATDLETIHTPNPAPEPTEATDASGEIRPKVTIHPDGTKSALTAEIQAFQGARAELSSFFEAKGVEVFGSEQAFEAAKLSAIESVVGEQPKSWNGGERFNPVYERLKLASLDSLERAGVADWDHLDRSQANIFLQQLGLEPSDSNFSDLEKWHAFYKTAIHPDSLQADGIYIKPNMTFDHLFIQYVIASKR